MPMLYAKEKRKNVMDTMNKNVTEDNLCIRGNHLKGPTSAPVSVGLKALKCTLNEALTPKTLA